jgi:hypothetical protein
MWPAMTAQERDRVRELVERSCLQQGVPLAVPPEVARDVAALIAVGGRRRRRSLVRAASEGGAGDDRAPVAS